MKLRNKVAAGVALFFLLGALLLTDNPVHRELVYFYYAGDYSPEQRAVMAQTRDGAPVSFSAKKDGVTYEIPLPEGAKVYPEGGYLAIDYEIWGHYLPQLKALNRYTFEQQGSILILESKDGNIRFIIAMSNVARRYELLEISCE